MNWLKYIVCSASLEFIFFAPLWVVGFLGCLMLTLPAWSISRLFFCVYFKYYSIISSITLLECAKVLRLCDLSRLACTWCLSCYLVLLSIKSLLALIVSVCCKKNGFDWLMDLKIKCLFRGITELLNCFQISTKMKWV